MKTSIKEWYMATFKTDELGQEINSEATFEGLFDTLDTYKDVYEFLGVDDSIVRERAFERLSELMKVDYDVIYRQWLLS